MAGLLELFTNTEATEVGKADVKAPAFSLTKVWGALTAAIAAVSGALPVITDAPQTLQIAAIAAGTVAFIAFLGLAAVDLVVRQRAQEARLRWPKGSNGSNGKVLLFPDQDELVLQTRHNEDEYEVLVAELEGEKVTLVAHRDKDFLQPTFQPRD